MGVTTLTVAASRTTSISFKSGTSSAATLATLDGLTLNGKLLCSGDGKVQFPPGSSGITAAASSLIQAAGGVRLSGNLNLAPIFIGGVQDQAASASVDVRDRLITQANILGDGVLTVKGSLIAKSRTIASTLDLQGTGAFDEGGNATIQSALFTGAGLSLQFAAALILEQPGSLVKFGVITACSANSLIQIRVRSLATLSNGRYTAMTYSSSTSATVLNCNVEIKDDAGNVLPLAKQTTTTSDSAPFGRRLLQSTTGKYEFNSEGKLEYIYSGNTSGAVASNASFLLLVVSILAGIFAAL